MPHATRAVAARGLPALAALLSGVAAVGTNPVIEVDFYRAMAQADIGAYELGNNDLASLAGVLKYVHTEAIAEHQIAQPDRTARKYGIDVIAKYPFHIKNPEAVVDPTDVQVRQVDFGRYMTFDHGVATNVVQQPYVAEYGDFVGVQHQVDQRFAYEDPYYWYSISGFCPNLPFGEKGAPEWPADACMNYTGGGPVEGGLCPDWEDGVSLPTGQKGCTYTYRNASELSLDVLTGITQQDCGGRLCRDWADFRESCTDSSLRRYFDANTRQITDFPYCVEYDISPLCAADCNAEACLALPEDERELGLPFWKGRCSDAKNKKRAELIAQHFGASGEHSMLTATAEADERCMYPGGMCRPSGEVGGMYCSRAWAGVCQECFVPGTVRSYSDQQHTPYCPYDVLTTVDYINQPTLAPRCNSTRPRDLCCLYTSSCTGNYVSGSAATYPLDEDGFALAAFQQNTTVMAEFLARVAHDIVGGTVENATLFDIAYWQWDRYPKKSRSLANAEAALARVAALFPTTSTEVPVPTTSTTGAGFLTAGASSNSAWLALALAASLPLL